MKYKVVSTLQEYKTAWVLFFFFLSKIEKENNYSEKKIQP